MHELFKSICSTEVTTSSSFCFDHSAAKSFMYCLFFLFLKALHRKGFFMCCLSTWSLLYYIWVYYHYFCYCCVYFKLDYFYSYHMKGFFYFIWAFNSFIFFIKLIPIMYLPDFLVSCMPFLTHAYFYTSGSNFYTAGFIFFFLKEFPVKCLCYLWLKEPSIGWPLLKLKCAGGKLIQ